MIFKPQNIELEEIVCQDVFVYFGAVAWQFFDVRLLRTIDLLRRKIGKPFIINNWHNGGSFDERGFRCYRCDIVKQAIKKENLYISPHMTGQAFDFDVIGSSAEEIRTWIFQNADILPFNIRLENGVNWIHIDTRDAGKRVYFFNQ